ncbi:hypothetical protein Tco_0815247 [Tanacetum coccineum]
MALLPPREQRHPFLRYHGLEYTNEDIADFEERLERIYGHKIHMVQVVDFQGMLELMRDGLFTSMRMEHHDDADLVRRRLSWRQFIQALGLHTEEEMESPKFARYWSESERMIPEKGDLHDYWRSISTDEDFLGPPPSYTLIRDLVLRLCHRMMAHNITRRRQAPKKSGAHISERQFVAQLAEHFGLLTAEILEGLTVISPELPIIDMAELPDAAVGASALAEDAPAADEGDQAILALMQAP